MSISTRPMTTDDWRGIRNFGMSEFKQPYKMGKEFVMWLDKVREMAGVPMHPSSDYRTPEHNASVGGAKDSAHTDYPCEAVDIKMTPTPDDKNWNHARYRIITAALALGCTRIGMYPNGSLHLDRTEGERPGGRIWIAVDNPARS